MLRRKQKAARFMSQQLAPSFVQFPRKKRKERNRSPGGECRQLRHRRVEQPLPRNSAETSKRRSLSPSPRQPCSPQRFGKAVILPEQTRTPYKQVARRQKREKEKRKEQEQEQEQEKEKEKEKKRARSRWSDRNLHRKISTLYPVSTIDHL